MREIRSDNGTNFVGAVRELREAIEEMDHDKITEKLRKQQIDWRFNPPGASHMGGVWERQIRTVRRILSTLLHEHGNCLDDESLHTFLSRLNQSSIQDQLLPFRVTSETLSHYHQAKS